MAWNAKPSNLKPLVVALCLNRMKPKFASIAALVRLLSPLASSSWACYH